jgi:glycosyltransferase involved in cell wall biosynthesis
MSRPTVSLACIAKNESNNVKRFLESFGPVVDEVIFVDTGSNDGTQEIAKSMGAKMFHFDWINDFSAARNFSFDQVKTDYVLWADLDDAMHNPEAFKSYRDHAMQFYDYVLAKYNYALDKDGKPLVTFARERLLKMSWRPRWNYFVHEGVPPPPNASVHYATTWAIDHLRTEEDLNKDRSRNLKIFEKHMESGGLDGRMTFYYGKELFENQQPEEAEKQITKSIGMDLQPHDRINAIQYSALSCLSMIEKLKPEHHSPLVARIRDYSHRGLMLDPNRAEFWTFLGDSYLRTGQLNEAMPFYQAAISCPTTGNPGEVYAGPIHQTAAAYTHYPRMQIAKIYANRGQIDQAESMAKELHKGWPSKETDELLLEVQKIKPLISLDGPKTKVPDIIFTCPPQTAYEFDEELYKSKPMGGSETALIEMAKWLRKLTGRPVKVFNMRAQALTSESGVEYISSGNVNAYFASKEPALHIAWRHNVKLTNAPTYLWCHDLTTPTVESVHNFDKVLCLTPFHRDYVNATQGVPLDKIIVTRNGIDPTKFDLPEVTKNPNKIVWMSSPDRGLDKAIAILDIVREKHPNIEHHVYYGLENLFKYGMADLGNKIKKMIEERPWIKYHGFTEQKKMAIDTKDAVLWLHPSTFIETFQITALEMLCSGIYPVIRRHGAIRDTLKQAEIDGMATLLDIECVTPEEHQEYARAVCHALETKAWQRVKVDSNQFAWSSVAQEWVNLFQL